MKPKEKAKNLVDRMWFSEAKESAVICVNEIVAELNKLPSKDLSDLQYWREVEYEISLL